MSRLVFEKIRIDNYFGASYLHGVHIARIQKKENANYLYEGYSEESRKSDTTLKVYDVLRQVVATLVDEGKQPGYYDA